MTARKPNPEKEKTRERLMQEAWDIITAAKAKANFVAASATLERAARIAGLWSDKAEADDAAERPATQVFTSEPLTPEQWAEKFAPKDD